MQLCYCTKAVSTFGRDIKKKLGEVPCQHPLVERLAIGSFATIA